MPLSSIVRTLSCSPEVQTELLLSTASISAIKHMPYKQITTNLNPSELTVLHNIVHALTTASFPQFKGEMKTRQCNTASNTKV
jgi:hypothetical protein